MAAEEEVHPRPSTAPVRSTSKKALGRNRTCNLFFEYRAVQSGRHTIVDSKDAVPFVSGLISDAAIPSSTASTEAVPSNQSRRVSKTP